MGGAGAEVGPLLLGRLDAGGGPAEGAGLHPPGDLANQDLWQGGRVQRALLRQASQVHRAQPAVCPLHRHGSELSEPGEL